MNLKAKKFKSNINHQGLNIATYGQAYFRRFTRVYEGHFML